MQQQVEIDSSSIEGGRLVQALDHYIAQAAEDVTRRPFVDKKRKVTLTITLKPKMEGRNGEVNMPEIEWCVSPSIPAEMGGEVRGIVRDGRLLVNPYEWDNPNQLTIAEAAANVTPIGSANGAPPLDVHGRGRANSTP